jgi:hypothetical protein
MNPSVCSGPNRVWRVCLVPACLLLLAIPVSAQQITVDRFFS